MNLEAEDVQEILRLLDAAHLDELHLETERFTLTLRRAADGGWTQQARVLAAEKEAPGIQEAPGVREAPTAREALGVREVAAAREPSEAPEASEAPRGAGGPARGGLWEVRAPLLGTFYRAPKPGAAPFVEVGRRVGEDTVVAIVETMKLMNPVLAGARGTVVEICLADGQFAEHGAVLLRIEPEVP